MRQILAHTGGDTVDFIDECCSLQEEPESLAVVLTGCFCVC